MPGRRYFVYILTNRRRTVRYTGITNDPARRIAEHRAKQGSKFNARYNADQLVYFETYDDVNDAIAREKQIKGGSRRKKLARIDAFNPEWRDFSEQVWLLSR